MKDEQYNKATEIKREIDNIKATFLDLKYVPFMGGLIYIPNNPEIVYNIKIALEQELEKLRKEFENL